MVRIVILVCSGLSVRGLSIVFLFWMFVFCSVCDHGHSVITAGMVSPLRFCVIGLFLVSVQRYTHDCISVCICL